MGSLQNAIDHEEIPLPCVPLQKLLFSATLSHDPEQLQHISLYRPMLFTVVAPKKGKFIKWLQFLLISFMFF